MRGAETNPVAPDTDDVAQLAPLPADDTEPHIAVDITNHSIKKADICVGIYFDDIGSYFEVPAQCNLVMCPLINIHPERIAKQQLLHTPLYKDIESDIASTLNICVMILGCVWLSSA